jgi:xylulokinase
MAKNLYLGLDLSTQSLTAVVIDPLNKALQQHAMNFDSLYPAYQTAGGVIIGDDPTVVHADPKMWVEALDDMLAWLNKKSLSSKISAIGVSAQQHGSVYLNQDAAAVLSHPDPSRSLLEQTHMIFPQRVFRNHGISRRGFRGGCIYRIGSNGTICRTADP